MNANALQLVLEGGWFVKVVLLILAGFSIASWGIIFFKWRTLNAGASESETFYNAYRSGASLTKLKELVRDCPASPLARLFETAITAEGNSRLGSLQRVLSRQAVEETERLQRFTPLLANTGSTTPFIGLLGTVWGIMDAFQGIGMTGSASLAIVAPAIAESLIATAAGLLAAIPAVMAYNHFLQRIKKMASKIDDFAQTLAETSGKVRHEAR